jgi:DNA end-binding protein Ku
MARRTEEKAKHRTRAAEREGVTEEKMAARSIAALTVSFGMVSIPVKLFSATEASRAISFNLLHKGCGSRLRQQYFCVKEDIPVARDEMVKGFEFAKDQYVQFTPEELKAMEEAGTHTADITEFVPIEAIDPVYFDKAYYLAPDKGGAKPYALLAKALQESKRCALGRWAARGKQYIVMIRPVDGGLVMQQLLYAAEVRSIKDIEIPSTEVKPAELKLAQQLIEQQAADRFDPAAYTDEVRARIEAAVQKKVEGQEVTMPEEPEKGAQVIDLMEALRASLEKKPRPRPSAPQEKPAEERKAAAARKPPKRAQQGAEGQPARRAARK